MTHLLRHIILLEKAVGAFAPKSRFLAQSFNAYDIVTLQELARKMACFINMPFFTITVTFAKQNESVAGHIEGYNSNSQNVFIEIDPYFINYPDAIIKVLAHEISHKYLALHHLSLNSTKDNEILTDVTAIYLGFGGYALNGGKCKETCFNDNETRCTRTVTNGYLDLEESAFVYDVVCRMRGVNDDKIFWGLNKDAVEGIRFVRKQYATRYPPEVLDLSPINGKIANVLSKLELVDLQFCNIDKIKILFSGALLAKNSEIESARKDSVKTRSALNQLRADVVAFVGPLAYLSVRIWMDDVQVLSELADGHLATVNKLNEFVSGRVPPDVTSVHWDALENIVIECPQCKGRLRLPTGKSHICVICPKCKYEFDYSTTCPEFKWVPPRPFSECYSGERRKPWFIRKLVSFFRNLYT